MGQQTSRNYVDTMMLPPLSNNGPVAEFFLNNASPLKSALVSEQQHQHTLNTVKAVLALEDTRPSSAASDSSWQRPEVRVVSGKAALKPDPVAKSIDKVCQGPLYKEVYYASVNMSVNHKDVEVKDDKPKISTLPPFKDIDGTICNKKSSQPSHEIETTPMIKHSHGQTKPRLVRRSAVCLRCKPLNPAMRRSPDGDSVEMETIEGISPLNGTSNVQEAHHLSDIYVTPPNMERMMVIPKTSTPKKGTGQFRGKMVHFASTVEAMSPELNGRLSPLDLESDYSSSSNRPQPLGSDCASEQCHEEFIASLMEKKRESELLEKINLKTPEKCKLAKEIHQDAIENELFKTVSSSQSRSSAAVQKDFEPCSTPLRWVPETSHKSSLASPTTPKVGEDESLPDDSLLRHYLTLQMDTSMNYEGCVKQWIQDIRTLVEAECLNVLQAKTLTKDPGMLSAIAVRNAQDTIKALQRRTENLLKDFDYVLESLASRRWPEFCQDALGLLQDIKSVLSDYSSNGEEQIAKMTKNEVCLKRACEDLEEFLKRNSDKSQSDERKATVKRNLLSVLRSLKELVDQFTIQQLAVIVELAEEGASVYCLQMALTSLTAMGQTGEAMCELIAKAGGPRALLSICVENKWRPLRAAALRVLTIVCCVPNAIRQLEQAGGIECVTDILCEENLEESARSEAAGLLAQITAPWMDSEGITLRGLVENLGKLIGALTDLARNTKSSEVLLLAAAALANLSFLDGQACELLRQYGSARVLIAACRQQALTECVFVKDQVATVLANMANVANCKTAVLEAGALVCLLRFMQMSPSKDFNSAELSACERVQQKSAIALSRLCTDKKTASAVVAMQGVKRLVRLCKDNKERNNSDSVLVAALATLRKIAAVCGTQEIKDMKAEELVEPKLWDSFLIYCSKQESFV